MRKFKEQQIPSLWPTLKMKIFNVHRWKVRIGDQKHNSKRDDGNLLILDILNYFKHPENDGVRAYFDVAILETENVTFSRGISPVCLTRSIAFLYFL